MLTVYTIPETCPKCKALCAKLTARCIPFVEKDLREIPAEARTDCIMGLGYVPLEAPLVDDGGNWLTGSMIEERWK